MIKRLLKRITPVEESVSLAQYRCDHEDNPTWEFTQGTPWFVWELRDAGRLWKFLTWSIEDYPDEILPYETVVFVERAANYIAAKTWWRFFMRHEADPKKADIVVTRCDSSHPTIPSPFKENTLGKAAYPWRDNWLQWKIWMNQDKVFDTINMMVWVLIHEFLHLFNLKHNPQKGSIMNETFDADNPGDILEDDVNWIMTSLWLNNIENE